MEIWKIVIENFKGIERVELSPVKPINVLIGRNNSGKTSILTCLSFLHEYFSRKDPSNPIHVPAGYFREGLDKRPELTISISVKQSKKERKEQFIRTKDAWNAHYSSPHISDEAINARLENDLFSSLTFNFVGLPLDGHFGLVSVNAKSRRNKGGSTDILIAESENKRPGTRILGIPLRDLFTARLRDGTYPTVLALAEKYGMGDRLIIQTGRSTLTGQPGELVGHLLSPAYEYIVKRFQTAFLVSPYRHANENMSAQTCGQLDQSGSNLVNYIHNLNLNNYAAFQNIADFVRGIVPEVGRLHPRFVGESGSSLELAYEWPDGTSVNLANMGGGVEQLLVLGSLLIHQRTACILWEEPESHLHPGAQEILLDQLETLVGDSTVFLTTQSPVFIRPSSKIAVHIITNPDGKSAMGKTLSEDDLQQAAAVIGARPGHLAQADIVLYVEGKTGAAALKEWLRKWPERATVLRYLQVEVQSLNVDEIANKGELIKALQKTNPNLIIFVDRDNETGKKEPKESRTILQTKCSKLGIPCIITEKRKVEDYFTREAIQKGLPSNLRRNFEKDFDTDRTIGEQLSEGWKVYNYRIAAAMNWEDIEKHKDIMNVFAEIARYADKLKPGPDVGG